MKKFFKWKPPYLDNNWRWATKGGPVEEILTQQVSSNPCIHEKIHVNKTDDSNNNNTK